MKRPTRVAHGAAAIALCTVATGAAVLGDGRPAAKPTVGVWPAATSVTNLAPRRTRGGDFNGDGHRDIAGSAGDNGVSVIYSGPQGPDPDRRQFLNPNAPNTPGLPDKAASFRIDIASADFDHDDYDDLVVTSAEPGSKDPDTLVIFYGGNHGLTDRTVSLKVGRTAPKSSMGKDFYGGHLAIGDFGDNGELDIVLTLDAGKAVFFRNVVDRPVAPETTVLTKNPDHGYPVIGDFTGDGYSDLAMIRLTHGAGTDPRKPKAIGEVQLGTAQGLSTAKAVFADGWIDESGAVAADVNGDGRDDLITPESRYPKSTNPEAMGISILLGTAQGLGARLRFPSPCRETIKKIAAGDVNGDGRADIAVGCDYDPGKLVVLPGTTQGIDTARAAVFNQKTPGMPGRDGAESPDWFGSAVTVGDLTGDGKADITLRAHQTPGSDDGNRLYMLPGSATGPTLKGSTMLTALLDRPTRWGDPNMHMDVLLLP
ncbi:VCBS repeat-containing protein [Spirillospora sp. NPDC029432]|uniref:FG-GAP repeat domain-containing protein n=1 Tax=Spirillospora sp. NPDC029432 TaxID=3154599 RepID=UPI003454B404